MPEQQLDKFLRATQVAALLGVSRQTLWRWVQINYLPPSRQVGPDGGRVGWLQSEIDQFIRTRIAVGADRVGAGK